MGRNVKNYDRFKQSLRADLEHWGENAYNRKKLSQLMSIGGYHLKKEKGVLYNANPTEKQIDFAWNYINKIRTVQTIIQVDFVFSKIRYKSGEQMRKRNKKTGRFMR